MKKLIVALASLTLSVGAYAQGTLGTVTFANSAGTRIMDAGTGAAVNKDAVVVGLYYSTDLTAPDSSLQLVTPTGTLLADGIFVAGTRNIPGTTPGQMALLQVRAWDPAYATYEDAPATALKGASNRMTLALGGGTLPTPSLVAQGGLAGFEVTAVPEPSTVALAMIGLGALLIRRRK